MHDKACRRFAGLFLLAAGFSAAAFSIHPSAGLLALCSAAAYAAAFSAFTRARYRRIARMSEQIDLLLHDAERLDIGDYEEGELSVLHSEIAKMTVRIREQNEALKKDKQFLADSLADIAHQLRTPLTSAGLTLPLIAKAVDEKGRRELLQQLSALFSQMDWLLSSLLKFSRLDAGMVEFREEAVGVKPLLEAALHPLYIPMELHDIALQTDLPEGAQVAGDFDWLAQAIQNILKNCMESAGDGGNIHIACTDTPLYTELTIHDSGPGFEKSELPHLFDRFYRGRHAGAAGYGIGLALCKSILTRQGAALSAGNHPQGGALFRIRFPK